MHAEEQVKDRLKRAREALGYTQKGMAEAVGSKLRSWQDYESGGKTPGSQVIAGMTRIGINANWVLTGDGPMLIKDLEAPHPAVEGIDSGIIRDVVEAIEELMAERFATMPPAEKAELTALLCEEIAEQERAGQMVNRRSAVRFALIGR